MRKLLLIIVALLAPVMIRAQATNYCNDQFYQTFESGTTGATPTPTDLTSSSKGRNMSGLWTVNPSTETVLTYSSVDMQALVAPGRLCGDSTTYTNAVGAHGLVLTGDGLADSNFVSVRVDFSPVYPNNMTDVWASVEYNEDYGTSGDKIDCFVIHGTTDFSSVNCYGAVGGNRFLDLECTNTPTSHGGDCGTGGGINPWFPSTSCPCKFLLHYGTGNGTTLGKHDLFVYDKNGALIGHIQHTSQLAADFPVYIKIGNQQGALNVTAGKHSWWDNLQFSPNLVQPGQFCAGASPTWTTSPDNASMQTCLTSASATDTVNVLSGTATWNTVTVNNNNGASIAGATTVSNAGLINASATDNTIINFTGGTNIFLGNLTQASTVTTVSGITWKWLSGGSSNSGVVSFVGPTSGACTPTLPTFRFNNNHVVVNTTTTGTVFSMSQCDWGVIDHNFYERQSGNAGMFASNGDRPYRGYHAWTVPLSLGTQAATYLETNTFNDSGGNNTEGPWDCYSGARYVFRFNYVQGHDGGCHGTDSDSSRSLISQEDYGNTFLNNTGLNYVTSRVRGGTALIFENVYNSAAGNNNNTFNGIAMTEYRDSGPPCSNCAGFGNPAVGLFVQSTDPTTVQSVTTSTTSGAGFGQFCGPSAAGRDVLVAAGTAGNAACNAANSGDTASTFFDGPGPYPARDQVGRIPVGQLLQPAYQWLNVVNGNSGNSALMVPSPPTTFIQECRDYYNYSPTFAGGSCATCSGASCSTTGGGGAGTTLPATCSLNEFFWKTNEGNWNTSTLTFPDGTSQGRLYKCGPAANQWTLYYTPLTYPHPLTGGTPPSTATPILSPNNSQIGNSADSLQPPVLTFGNQGTNTTSMAIPISINNCSTTVIPSCSGTGNLTLAATPLSITGTSPVGNTDFTFSLGTCAANLVIASGGNCQPTITFKPTATAGTAETATLTVSYANGTPSQTMSLTGTSATVTVLTSITAPFAMVSGTLYQLGANITCAGTCFTFGSNASMNQNGFTVTWNNTAQTTPTGAYLTGGFNSNITVYNGTISQGVGTNSQSTTYTNNFLAAIGPGAGNLNFSDNNAFFNLTFNQSFQYWAAINTLGPGTTGGNLVAHDITINNTAIGNCSNPGCRSFLQSTMIKQPAANNQPTTPTHIYNVTLNGSAQGGIMAQAPGNIVENNLVNIGNVTGTNSNNFGIYNWGPGTARNNIINTPLASNNGRGLAMQGDGPAGTKLASGNFIQAFELPNSTEYASNAGCEIGGVYGIQFDDNPQGPSVNANGNTINVFVNKCGGTGLRLTDTELVTNTSTNNIYTVSRQSGALDCTITTQADPNFGCAMGVSIAGNYNSTNPPASPPSAFTSTGDTFTVDSGCILIGTSGAFISTEKFFSMTCNKGSNPSPTFHTFWAANGVAGTIWVIDPTVGPGVSLTDTRFLAQSSNQAPVSLYVQWTQTITAQNSSAAPISGATVTYTGPLETDTCTTNSSGVCSVVVTQNRLNNDTAANQIEVRNPYTRTVSASGFSSSTVSGITLTSPNSVTVTLTSGSTPAAAPTFSPVAGSYVGSQLVTMSSTTAGFTITSCFDTTNTCTPSTAGSTFTVTSTGFLRAFANATGFTQSSTSSAQYTITAAPPVFSPTAGAFIGPITVNLSTSLGSVICYTTNGTTPATNGSTGCTSGTLFSAPIPLALNTTIQAIAGGTGLSDSAVSIGNFAIQGAAAPATFAKGSQIILNGGAIVQ